MNFRVSTGRANILQLMRSLGYSSQYKQDSFIRRLGRGLYPHFHIYVRALPEGLDISLHLDQKNACYAGQTAHSGEYDGERLADEKQRILASLGLDK